MKPEQRHELKTNELADWVAHLPQWLKDNQRTIIYVLIVMVVVIVGWFWLSRKKSASVTQSTAFTDILFQLPERKYRVISAYLQGQDISFGLTDIADQLARTGQSLTSKPMSAFALIERANTIRTELHYRRKSPDENQLTTQINKAKEAYQNALSILTPENTQQAIGEPIQYPLLTATAKFGLGLCEEELGNFDQAKKIYSEIGQAKELQNTPAAVQAAQRLATMADYQQQVVFATAPKLESMTIPAELPQPTEVPPLSGIVLPEPATLVNVPDVNQ